MWADTVAALKFGLSIWNSKETNKYLDELIELDEKWYAEYKKGEPRKVNGVIKGYSTATLDEYASELRKLSARVFAAAGYKGVRSDM